MSEQRKIGVVRFLGTNCDQDVFDALGDIEGLSPEWLWYENKFKVDDFDGVVVPGGFSYGDYLRSGALASKMAVMDSVEDFAKAGKPVLGICNGFQVLTERNLLPGALLKNKNLKFIDRWVELKVHNTINGLWNLFDDVQAPDDLWQPLLNVPVAHGDGCYFVSPEQLSGLKENSQIWLTYDKNPNGSVEDIAGVLNAEKNVAGLMPHPERAMAQWMGSDSGKCIIQRFLKS